MKKRRMLEKRGVVSYMQPGMPLTNADSGVVLPFSDARDPAPQKKSSAEATSAPKMPVLLPQPAGPVITTTTASTDSPLTAERVSHTAMPPIALHLDPGVMTNHTLSVTDRDLEKLASLMATRVNANPPVSVSPSTKPASENPAQTPSNLGEAISLPPTDADAIGAEEKEVYRQMQLSLARGDDAGAARSLLLLAQFRFKRIASMKGRRIF